jgi:transcriptional regulator with XRE-family HTH domain
MQAIMANNDQDTSTDLSIRISDAMEERGVSIRDLAKKLDLSYEHVRRIVRGITIPSTALLLMMCSELGLDKTAMLAAARMTKVLKDYGGIPPELIGHKAGLEPIERVWDRLTDDQQKDAVTMIEGWARRNRSKK